MELSQQQITNKPVKKKVKFLGGYNYLKNENNIED